MKVGYLITARLKSTRLPLKLLKEVKGKPIISHMIDRLKLAKKIDQIIICTSENPQDRPLIQIAEENNIDSFCGDPDDVIARLSTAAEENNLDYVLNITGDCPFVDPIYVDKVVEAFLSTDADLIRTFGLPHGAFSYGIKPEALKKILEIKGDKDTEVWGRYFTDTDLFKVYDLPIDNPKHQQPDLRMTLDYPEDLAFFEKVFDHLYQENHVFSLDAILDLLEKHPEIVLINKDCARSFQKRFQAQSEISLKPRYHISKAAIIGCGSIGQRHIRNLQKLGVTDIFTLRSKMGHHQNLPNELKVYETKDWQELMAKNVDVAIISNPTSLHMETVERFLPTVKGIFVEKPLSHSFEMMGDLLEKIDKYKTILFVGYNLLFHEAVLSIKDILNTNDIGAPLSFQAQAGHWLPDWHPYENYKKAYYAKPDLGGGVTLTLVHEIQLAQELFGEVSLIHSIISPSKLLPLDVDTIVDLMMHHKSGTVSQIHLDFIQRPLHRSGVISCERGWISYDLANSNVFAQLDGEDMPKCIWEGTDYDPNQQYLNEMETFLQFVREGRMRHPFDAWHAAHTVAIVDASFNSASNGVVKKVFV